MITRPKCFTCQRRATAAGEYCAPCKRSYRRWLRTHDGTMGSAITWARARRAQQRKLVREAGR
jgi:hypothetical protein